MTPWNVIAQVGDFDHFYPSLQPEIPRFIAAIDKKGSPYLVANDLLAELIKQGVLPPSTAIDLVYLATIVYTADLRIWRGYNTEDGWTRMITLHVPVTDPDLWSGATSQLTNLLSFLTGDEWSISFRYREAPPPGQTCVRVDPLPTAVCLFSGGLDSFVGAIDLLAYGERPALVGHYGTTQREQIEAYKSIKTKYENHLSPFWFYLVPPRVHEEQKVESTMRARSFLFLSLGTCVASALQPGSSLFIPENGLISLNVPLTYGRIGAHSTRTTHPHTVALFHEVLTALGIDVALRTPYRFKTKGEMLNECRDQEVFRQGVHSTMSCSRPFAGRFHGRPVGQHCGYCVPCIIRRAALNVCNLDSEPRHRDVLDPSIRADEAAGADKRAFLMAIERIRTMSRMEIAADIIATGPIDPNELDDLVDLFLRGTAEVESFLKQNSST